MDMPRKQKTLLDILSVFTLLGIFLYCFISYFRTKYEAKQIKTLEQFNNDFELEANKDITAGVRGVAL